nr:hypothetical protein [Tanacetum cinerariifolium]
IMNQEEIQQAAREESCVSRADRVKISTTNIRIDPMMTQREETYQVVLDIIKNTTFYKERHLAMTDFINLELQKYEDDGVLSRIKFVRIGEDVQENGKDISSTMLTDAIKQSEVYKAFIGYSTGLVPPKKTRCKGLKGKQQ